MLIDAHWLDMQETARQWASLLGQDYGICKIQDVRGSQYLAEITKYVVKPAQMVAWPAEEIAAFVGAIRGIRFFAAFGTLFRLARQIKAEMAQARPPAEACECGATDWRWTDETREALIDARRTSRRR